MIRIIGVVKWSRRDKSSFGFLILRAFFGGRFIEWNKWHFDLFWSACSDFGVWFYVFVLDVLLVHLLSFGPMKLEELSNWNPWNVFNAPHIIRATFQTRYISNMLLFEQSSQQTDFQSNNVSSAQNFEHKIFRDIAVFRTQNSSNAQQNTHHFSRATFRSQKEISS